MGKAELPKELSTGHNIDVSLEGSIVSETKSDNEDGSYTYTYTFKPVRVSLLTETGEALKLKDTRSHSKVMHARIFGVWRNSNATLSEKDFYGEVMTRLTNKMPDLLKQIASDIL